MYNMCSPNSTKSLVSQEEKIEFRSAEECVEILHKIEPKEIVQIILPQLKEFSKKSFSNHFNLSARTQSKFSYYLFYSLKLI